MYFYTTHLLYLRIGLKNRKRRESDYSKKNCPHEINMYFYTTHQLKLRIGLKNQKKREW